MTGPSETEIDTVKKLEQLQFENDQQENSYWHNVVLSGYQSKSFQVLGDISLVHIKTLEARNKVYIALRPQLDQTHICYIYLFLFLLRSYLFSAQGMCVTQCSESSLIPEESDIQPLQWSRRCQLFLDWHLPSSKQSGVFHLLLDGGATQKGSADLMMDRRPKPHLRGCKCLKYMVSPLHAHRAVSTTMTPFPY